MDTVNQHRRSIRLKGYDYTQAGAYFVTLCTWQRECLFGDIIGGVMRLNEVGRIVADEWRRMKNHFAHLELGAFVVMPNHIHGILIFHDYIRATRPAPIQMMADSGPLSNQAAIPHDGSPRPEDNLLDGSPRSTTDPIVRATRAMPNQVSLENASSSNQARIPQDGSPRPEDNLIDGSPRSTTDPIVRATRAMPNQVSLENASSSNQAGIPQDGSPRPEDNLLDGSPRPTTDPIVRATRPAPIQMMADSGPLSNQAGIPQDGSPQRTRPHGPPPGSLGAMIGQFKSRATKRIWRLPGNTRTPIWQRNYYEHIIRDEAEWQRIHNYIQCNPARWKQDTLMEKPVDYPGDPG